MISLTHLLYITPHYIYYRDKYQRSELCKASVEFVAPGDYMVRPPQPPAYVFVIDVSSTSVQSGMIGRRSVYSAYIVYGKYCVCI